MKKYQVVLQLWEFDMRSKLYDTREEAEQVANMVKEAQFCDEKFEPIVIEEVNE